MLQVVWIPIHISISDNLIVDTNFGLELTFFFRELVSEVSLIELTDLYLTIRVNP